MSSTPTTCDRGTHAYCGCIPLAYRCCLNCPLPNCLEEREGRRKPVSASRGKQIMDMLKNGKRPVEIRILLQIDKKQYRRALRAIA